MKRILRAAILLLALAIGGEVYWLWLDVEPIHAQTTPFLGRPYYGPSVARTAIFDHQYPQYEREESRFRSTIVRNDGAVGPSNNCPNCYSGHDAHDFALMYKPVVSAAVGNVSAAGWHSTDHSALLGLMVRVNHGNNHETVYGHLSMVRYQPPTPVGRWQIGTSGTTGNSTGPHLHFSVEYYHFYWGWLPKDPYGWSGGYLDPWQVQYGIVSENLWLPEPERTISLPPRNGEYYIDDGDNGTSYTCSDNYFWWTQPFGHNGDLQYTYANGSSSNCKATWGGATPLPSPIHLPSTGLYEIEAFVPNWSGSNPTHAARYTIYYVYGTGTLQNTVVVDQSRAMGQWLSLGRYTFNQGSLVSHYVKLEDATYVDTFVDQSPRKVLVDAVRWVKAH